MYVLTVSKTAVATCDEKRPEEQDHLLTGTEKCASGVYELTLAMC